MKMKIRWANLWDMPEAVGCLIANREYGDFDHRVLTYPSTRVMRAEDEDGMAVAYLPAHTGLILESLGWAPEIRAADKVEAAVKMLSAIECEAFAAGARESFFLSSDERTNEFCRKHLGFEPVRAMRNRL